MAQENFSVSMNWSSNEPRAGAGKRYLSLPFEAHPAEDGQALLLVAGAPDAQRIPIDLARLLSCCDRLRSLDEQARHTAERMRIPAGHLASIRRSLEVLVERGLLIDETQVLRRLTGDQGLPDPGSIETLFVRTCARPETLRNLLESLGRRPGDGLERCVILDDAREEDARAATRKTVESMRSSLDIQLHLVDRPRRRQLLGSLARSLDCRPDALDWFFEGGSEHDTRTYGAGPNLALLLAAGSCFALMDDDATLDGTVPGNAAERLRFRSGQLEGLWLPRPGASWPPPDAAPLETSPLVAHAAYLGRQVGELVADRTRHDDEMLEEITPNLLHQLGEQPVVKLTTSGVSGDPGTEDLSWIYAASASDLEPFRHDQTAYREAVFGRRVLRCARRAVATPAFALMTTTLTGFDNRQLLLPTAARERGEDMLCGALAAYLYPNCLQLSLPHALEHRRAKPRRWTADDLDRPRRPSRGRFLSAWLEDLGRQCSAREPQARIELLAAGLRDLAARDRHSLSADIARNLAQLRSTIIGEVEATLAQLEPPEWMSADFRRVIAAVSSLPEDEIERLEAVAESTQELAAEYAERLGLWCRAWEHCRERGIERLLDDADA
jgi:hypothetical protein